MAAGVVFVNVETTAFASRKSPAGSESCLELAEEREDWPM